MSVEDKSSKEEKSDAERDEARRDREDKEIKERNDRTPDYYPSEDMTYGSRIAWNK